LPAHLHAAGKGEAVAGNRWLISVFAVFVTYSAVPARAQPEAAAVIVIHDSANVPAGILEKAKVFAAGVFSRAGVQIAWDSNGGLGTACRAGRGVSSDARFCVQVLLRAKNPQSAPGQRRVMGMALAADERRAVLSLYFDAVTDVAQRYGTPLADVLGIALAHELGHVMLPPPSHSAVGIMQPSWEGDDLRHAILGDAAFTEDQAAAMRARLSRQ
jgi:hypothetical protein